jgi:hypothetical protein
MTGEAKGARTRDVLVRIEDLSDLMQRAVAVIGQALSFASQHIHTRGGGRAQRRYVHDKPDRAMRKHLVCRQLPRPILSARGLEYDPRQR